MPEPTRSDYADLARLRDARWQRQQHDQRGITIAFVVALLLHLVAAWFVRDWMRLRPIDEQRGVIAVRLIEPADVVAELVPPPPPLPEPPPRVETVVPVMPRPTPRAATAAASPAAAQAPTARIVDAPAPSSDAAPSVRIYGVDGKIDVSNLPQVPTAGFSAPAVVPQTRKAPALPYRPTAFASQWARDDENAFQEFVRKRTVTKSWRTKWGGGFSCTWSLIVGGCGWGYAPPNPEGMKKVRANPPMRIVREVAPDDAPPPWLPGMSAGGS